MAMHMFYYLGLYWGMYYSQPVTTSIHLLLNENKKQ